MQAFALPQRWPPPDEHDGYEPVWHYWQVSLWIQGVRPQIEAAWHGPRCGPWLYYATVWAHVWEAIPSLSARVETGGLYARLLWCIEEWQWTESEGWQPVNNI